MWVRKSEVQLVVAGVVAAHPAFVVVVEDGVKLKLVFGAAERPFSVLAHALYSVAAVLTVAAVSAHWLGGWSTWHRYS